MPVSTAADGRKVWQRRTTPRQWAIWAGWFAFVLLFWLVLFCVFDSAEPVPGTKAWHLPKTARVRFEVIEELANPLPIFVCGGATRGG